MTVEIVTAASKPVVARTIAVLHLEDSPLDAELISEQLEAGGLSCAVTRVENGPGFIAALRQRPFDVILSDFSLPNYDGVAALSEAKAACPDVPFLFVSGAIGEERAIDSLHRGATDYVLKQRLDRLVPAVRRALREAHDREERRRASERTSRLQSIAAALATALRPDEVTGIAVAHATAAVGGLTGACWLMSADDKALVLSNDLDFTESHRTVFGRVPLDAHLPIALAARNMAPFWLESRADYEREFAEYASATQRMTEDSAAACLPLVADGRRLGALAVIFDGPRSFDEADRALLAAIAQQCAQALDRARLYDAEREARERFALLARASEVLAATLDYETTLQNVAEIALPVLADWCVVDLVEEGQLLHRVAAAATDPGKRDALESLRRQFPPDIASTQPASQALRARRSLSFHDLTPDAVRALARNEEHAALARELAPAAVLAVPMNARGTTIGVLSLVRSAPGARYEPADVFLAEEIARRAALAIDNARLFHAAQEANHLKDEFLATVSHELRTPLNAMLGWTRMLRAGTLSQEKHARALETIERNATTQVRLIEDLLDISRIVTGRLRLNLGAVDPRLVIESAMDAVRPAAEARGVRIEHQIDPSVGTFTADPDRLQQVIWNLLNNAVKFTPGDGIVRIRLDRDPGQFVFAIEDTGQGIAPEFLPHVFERFRQADASATRRYGGLGLGLAIVKHLVELHGGTVEARSEGEGRGATFIVRLPSTSRAAGDRPSPLPVRTADVGTLMNAPRLDGLRVLLAEDEPDAREMVSTALEALGALVEGVGTASEALAAVRQNRPDVIISDIGMPDEDGYSLIRALRALPREQGGRIPALALTAYTRIEDRTQALAAGFSGYVSKPVEPTELALLVANLAGRFARS